MNLAELRAAAERRRKHNCCKLSYKDRNQSPYYIGQLEIDSHAEQVDACLLADHAAAELAKVRADDGEELTKQWLDIVLPEVSCGFRYLHHLSIVEGDGGTFRLWSGAILIRQLVTRGDVRRLAAELGIELNES